MRTDSILNISFSGPFAELLIQYISFKRAQGYQYGQPIVFRLREMDLFFKEKGIREIMITREMYYAWTAIRSGQKITTMGRRRSAIRGFAKYLQSLGYEAYAGHDDSRIIKVDFIPYIFSDDEISRMNTVLDRKYKGTTVQRESFRIAFLLYALCGLRLMEALNLVLDDVESATGKIVIRNGKNGVCRIIMASDSLLLEIRKFVSKYRAADPMEPFLCSECGEPLKPQKIYPMFHELLDEAEIALRVDGKRQRIHDLRHTFAVNALKNMEQKGFDLYISIPLLSRYLGHKSIVETEYYLRLTETDHAAVMEKCAAAYPGLFPTIGGKDE